MGDVAAAGRFPLPADRFQVIKCRNHEITTTWSRQAETGSPPNRVWLQLLLVYSNYCFFHPAQTLEMMYRVTAQELKAMNIEKEYHQPMMLKGCSWEYHQPMMLKGCHGSVRLVGVFWCFSDDVLLLLHATRCCCFSDDVLLLLQATRCGCFSGNMATRCCCFSSDVHGLVMDLGAPWGSDGLGSAWGW